MTQISEVSAKKQLQGLTRAAQTSDSSQTTDFDSLLKGALNPNAENKVSEEELFASLIHERLTTLKGSEVADKYDKTLKNQIEQLRKPDGFVPYEDAARASLMKLRDRNLISADDYKKVYAESFQAAQLDDHKDLLWDSRGGGQDITIAMSTLDQALKSAQELVKKFDSGELDPLANTTRAATAIPTEVKPSGTSVDGAAEFLFKPISSNEGKLAVLLPKAFAHLVDSVLIRDDDGKEIDRGTSTGYGDAGIQEKFRFNRQGAEYPKNIKVEVRMMDGTITTYDIPDPSKRYD